ncbi:neuroglian-like [Diprion similis]|uniref:neuroglian-like n=1 Tax=Diprion similis TaxID=362088 RepID=UPI001EF76188|nr:neuroglian-like [Diprion similis]
MIHLTVASIVPIALTILHVSALSPEITQPPTNGVTVDGKSVRIPCRVSGVPEPEVKWFKNGQELTAGRYRILESGDLEIDNVHFGDAGTYRCNALNKFGSEEASGNLEVKEHTTITDEPEDYEVAAGSTATFRCNAVTDLSLSLIIDWLRNGERIDFGTEQRFIMANDYSLTITKTIDSDSGTYTCVARTELDEAKAEATLMVQNVPEAPRLEVVMCDIHEANVQWVPTGDNRAPILRYTIQSKTSLNNDTWVVIKDDIPATAQNYTVPLTPWVEKAFRVLAWNKIGVSLPSQSSEACVTPPDVPHMNPKNVRAAGTNPHNMVIRWTVMPRTDRNGPGFKYRVFYKRDADGAEWTVTDINNWKLHKLQIDNLPTYQRYKIKIIAINDLGESRIAANEVFGYSGEDVPQQAPGNFTLLNVTGSTSALFSWSPVPEKSIRGKFRGYKIQTWTDKNTDENITEIHVNKDRTRFLFQKLVPFSKNYVRILAYNKRYYGPPSDTLSFETPEGVPGMVQSFDADPLGSGALNLTWAKPEHPNGILTGYRIYYETVSGTDLGPIREMRPSVTDPEATSVELHGLLPETTYRIHIRATTRAGEGEQYFIERSTDGPDTEDYYDE